MSFTPWLEKFPRIRTCKKVREQNDRKRSVGICRGFSFSHDLFLFGCLIPITYGFFELKSKLIPTWKRLEMCEANL